eukprot:TRINITY_DN1681_c0_g1_i2.p1 TRINITY_DN1681_c0_g1~~TRINITY_DN1681_c0_g1_i2.p1  ORF type:complete len:1235 (+),score=146.27 TRINITY_DN1681_c0_g1_i2:500-4204(+)
MEKYDCFILQQLSLGVTSVSAAAGATFDRAPSRFRQLSRCIGRVDSNIFAAIPSHLLAMQVLAYLVYAVILFSGRVVSEPTATATWTKFHNNGPYVDTKGTAYIEGVVPPEMWPVGAPSYLLTWSVSRNITFVCGAASAVSNDEGPRRYCAAFNSTARAFVWYDPYSLPMGRHDALCWYHRQTNSIWFYGGTNTGASTIARYTLYRANITANGTALNAWELMQGSETEDSIYPNATFPGGSSLGLPTWTDPYGNFYVWGEIDPYIYSGIVHPPIWKLDPLTLNWTRYFGSRRQSDDPVAGPIGAFGPNYAPRMRSQSAWTATRSGLVWFYGGVFTYPVDAFMFAGDFWALNTSSMEWAYMGGPLLNYTGQQYSDGGHPHMFSPLGTFHPKNFPGARSQAKLAEDDDGNIWLMGGGGGYYGTELWADLCVFTASTTRQWACVSYASFNTPNARVSESADGEYSVWPCAVRPGLWFPGSRNGNSGFFLLQGNGHADRGDMEVVPQPWSLADGWFVETSIVDAPSPTAGSVDQGFHVDVYSTSNLGAVLWAEDIRTTGIAMDWGTGSPFSPSTPLGELRFSYQGFIMSPYPVDTTLGWIILSDDGASFTLYSAAGPSSIGDLSPHPPQERYGDIILRPGANRFLVDHYDGASFAFLALNFRPPGDVRRRVVPAEWMSLTGVGPTPFYSPEPNPMTAGFMLEQFWNTTSCTGTPTRVRHWNSSALDFVWNTFENPMWNPIYTRPKSCFKYTMWVNLTSVSTPVGFIVSVRNGGVKVLLNNLPAVSYTRGDTGGSTVADAGTAYVPNIPNKLVVEISSNGDVDYQGRTDEARVQYTLGTDAYPVSPSVARTYNWAPPPVTPPMMVPSMAAPTVEAPVVTSGFPPNAANASPVSGPTVASPEVAGNLQQQGLGAGPIAGIIIAIIAGVVAAILIALFFVRRRNRGVQSSDTAQDAAAQPLEPSHYGAVSLSADLLEDKGSRKGKGGKKKGNSKQVDSEWESSSSDEDLNPELAEQEAIIRKGLKKEWVIPWKELDVLGRLGHGSFGVVMKAEYGGAEVAMKQCALTLDRSQLEQFKAESILVLSLKPHPNIVHVLGICLHRGSLYLVMELCELGSLDGYIAENELSLKQKLKIAEGVALGIRHLHNNNVIHRDIACRNVLLSEGLKAKLCDFGMSRLVEQFEKKGNTNTAVGPIRFMAPESLAAGSEFSEKSDVWMFCCFLVELWTGKSPHADKNLIDGP